MVKKTLRIARKGVLSWKQQGTSHIAGKILQKLYFKVENTPLLKDASQEVPAATDSRYQHWILRHYPRHADLQNMAEVISILKTTPVISIIVPTYNTPKNFLVEAIESVRNQVYPYWELCLADDCSSAPHVRALLKQYAAKDVRIKVCFRSENGHISEASNSALSLATGEFIGLLDHDDMLPPHALYEMALMLNKKPHLDMIYSDEDKLDHDYQCYDPFFKPDWSPDSLLSRAYTSHFSVYRHSIIKKIGGFRKGFEGSQDYDLMLRFSEQTQSIGHIPKILYHWRAHEASTAQSLETKDYSIEAGKKALEEALVRRGEPGVVYPNGNGHFIVRYHLKAADKVTVLIPTRDLAPVLEVCLSSLFEKTSYDHYEVVVIDNGSQESETHALFDQWKQKEPQRFRVVSYDAPFNFSTVNNFGVSQTDSPYLLFLNNDTEIIHADWMQAMIEQAQRPSIGAVGACLLYSDKTLQHAGVIAGIGGVAGHSHKTQPSDIPGYFDQIQTVNNYSAVTAACLMCRREVFEEVGGFEETLAYAFNDIDFCFKLHAKGYYNVYLPHVRLFHHESKSRGYEDTPEKQQRFANEIAFMENKWPDLLKKDPFYNPNLTLTDELYSYSVAFEDWKWARYWSEQAHSITE